MIDQTKIEWTDFTVNFWEGCQKVGPGCDHCYAEARDVRFTGGSHWGPGAPRRMVKGGIAKLRKIKNEAVTFNDKHGRWPRVFCSSLSDVFDNAVDPAWRLEAFTQIEIATPVRIQLLTKRVGNVERMLPESWVYSWPRNVGLMITVVDQKEADRDIPKLLDLKARLGIPWVGLSIEPMLGPVNLTYIHGGKGYWECNALTGEVTDMARPCRPVEKVDWVICGGESGPKARPMHPDWVRDLCNQCAEAGTPFLFKQWGEWLPCTPSPQEPFWDWANGDGQIDAHHFPDFACWPENKGWTEDVGCLLEDEVCVAKKVGKAKAGRLLDGRTWDGVVT